MAALKQESAGKEARSGVGTGKSNAGRNKSQKKITNNSTYHNGHSKGKADSGNRARSTGNRTKMTEQEGIWIQYQDEIVLMIVLVLSILLLLSHFHLCGSIGEFINQASFGLFGFMAYLFPMLFFFGVAFYLSNKNNRIVINRLACGVVLFLVMGALLHVGAYGDSADITMGEIYASCASGKDGGGIISGGLAKLLCSFLDVVGTYIVLIAVIVVLLMFITEKLFFSLIRKTYQEQRRVYREQRELYREQEEEEILKEEEMPVTRKRRKLRSYTFFPEDEKSEKDVEMRELVPQKLVIHRGDMTEIVGGEPYYETELKNKFGHTQEETEPVKEVKKVKEVKEVKETKKTKEIKETKEAKEAKKALKVVKMPQEPKSYQFPTFDLLNFARDGQKGASNEEVQETAQTLQKTLDSFGVKVTVTNVSCGPAVTRYELQPERGIKVSRITGLADDIKLNLAAADIRIEAPIPGKAAVGIEVPNKETDTVYLRELLQSDGFREHKSNVAFAVGKDIGGQVVVTDIAKMPHLLIAGATGSGKSVCINTLIMSILYKAHPDDVKLIMVDPKVVELSVYNGIPHLLIPVVTEPKKASGALNWAVMEMTERYQRFAEIGVREIMGYNEKIASVAQYKEDPRYVKMPQIVIIVDELADLMMVAPGEVEDAICRLAQLARAAGIHLIIATQRPSVNVITGLIKANIPSRIAFAVSSAIDSRTILDGAGAEKLLGKGDMLFFPTGLPKPIRVQGAFVSDQEVTAVVEFLASQNEGNAYNSEIIEKVAKAQPSPVSTGGDAAFGNSSGQDEYFVEAGKLIIEKEKASIGMLQRVYKIGFNRAARIMDQLSDAGVVGAEEGTKPRKVLMTLEEFENYLEHN